MLSDRKMKKDKEIVLELETQIKEIRHQLNEQLRCLDQRLECHYCMVWELQDFYQRRAEVELEYSRGLDKLVKQIMVRHRSEKQRREQWTAFTTYKMWQTMLGVTTKQSRNHSILAETFSTVLTSKFTQLLDDMQRIYKKCREIAVNSHNEMTKVATELHSTMKTYHLYHGRSRQSHTKLQRVQTQRLELKKSVSSKREQRFDSKTKKHENKFSESNQKTAKARNDYILALVSANAAIRKFFVEDQPELINAMDYGYHVSLAQIMMVGLSAEEHTCHAEQDSVALLALKTNDLNQREDRQAFLQQYHQIFSLPKKFDFQPHKDDSESEVSAEVSETIGEELAERFQTITERLQKLKLETDELWKTLDTTDSALLERLTIPDVDVASLFQVDKEQPKPTVDVDKQKLERFETEAFYLSKFATYQNLVNLIARLQAKCTVIQTALVGRNGGEMSLTDTQRRRPASVMTKRKRPLGKSTLESRPKLFGGSIEEYYQATGQEIPAIVISCIRIINLYGMHHQGVFRVPGLQHEITDYKNQFERGEEPLLCKAEGRDVNSVAGVLKLYFRELREPLFPVQMFDQLIACSKYDVNDPDELKKCIQRIQELVLPLPRPIVVVARYLFAFLNHLSELSDENMMDAHNLSVCFGPTLMPMPADQDQVRNQNYVNELIRILIVYHEKIFPVDTGIVYEKCMVEDVEDEGDVEDSLDSLLEDAGLEGTGSEDDLDVVEKEAVALFDFKARNEKELSLKKGDTVCLHTRVSSEWWKGSSGGQTGLIPHSYIAVQTRDTVDKGAASWSGSTRMSTESLPSKALSTTSGTVLPPVGDSEPLDRSISQPNIAGGLKLPAAVPPSPTVLASCSSTSSDLSRGGYASADSLGSMSSKDDMLSAPLPNEDTQSLTTERSTRSASPCAENVPSLSLTVDKLSSSLSESLEPTPDLVLNLPTTSENTAVLHVHPPLTSAEMFASAEHGTIKKSGTPGRLSASGEDGTSTDEVFPQTPVEVTQALEQHSFSFDLLPSPPPAVTGVPEVVMESANEECELPPDLTSGHESLLREESSAVALPPCTVDLTSASAGDSNNTGTEVPTRVCVSELKSTSVENTESVTTASEASSGGSSTSVKNGDRSLELKTSDLIVHHPPELSDSHTSSVETTSGSAELESVDKLRLPSHDASDLHDEVCSDSRNVAVSAAELQFQSVDSESVIAQQAVNLCAASSDLDQQGVVTTEQLPLSVAAVLPVTSTSSFLSSAPDAGAASGAPDVLHFSSVTSSVVSSNTEADSTVQFTSSASPAEVRPASAVSPRPSSSLVCTPSSVTISSQPEVVKSCHSTGGRRASESAIPTSSSYLLSSTVSPALPQSAVSRLVLATHKQATSVASFPEPLSHRPPPSLAAHSAALQLLSQKHESSAATAAGAVALVEKAESSAKPEPLSADRPKSKPPPVKKKPAGLLREKFFSAFDDHHQQ